MSDIHIVWLSDESDCETCGPSYSEGARVFIDGVCVVDLPPIAHCYDGNSYTEKDVYGELLEYLGYRVTHA